MEIDKYKSLFEAILFCENDVVKTERLSKISGITKNKVKNIMEELKSEYEKKDHGIMISEIADGYSFQIKKEVFPYIKDLYKIKPQNKISKSILTVLSIIAYKQPITKGEVEIIRGVSSDNAIKKLIELSYVKIVGRKDVIGKPLLYGTTDDFLKYFNLKSIQDLPKIGELKGDEFNIDE